MTFHVKGSKNAGRAFAEVHKKPVELVSFFAVYITISRVNRGTSGSCLLNWQIGQTLLFSSTIVRGLLGTTVFVFSPVQSDISCCRVSSTVFHRLL